jgi:hypothetical protein
MGRLLQVRDVPTKRVLRTAWLQMPPMPTGICAFPDHLAPRVAASAEYGLTMKWMCLEKG